MKRIQIHVFYLIVAFYFYSCHNAPAPNNTIVCTDSSYHAIKIDTLIGYGLRTDVDLIQVQNFYLFDDAKHFEKLFTPLAGSAPAPINFTKYFVAANVLNNRAGALVNGEPSTVSVPLRLHTDTCFIKNCVLNIPFFIEQLNPDSIPWEHLAENYTRKFFLFQVPRSLGLTHLFFDHRASIGTTGLFTDYAEKQRLIKLPEGYKLTAVSDELPYFPDGTIVATVIMPVIACCLLGLKQGI